MRRGIRQKTDRHFIKLGILLLSTLFCAFHFKQTRPKQQRFELSGAAQGTTYHISYYATDELVKKQQVDEWLAQIDTSMSIYKPYSLIRRFNGGKEGIALDQHLKIVLQKSLEIFRKSAGLFDITVAPLVQAWGFGVSPISHEPDSAEIRKIKPCVGSDLLLLQNDSLKKLRPCVQIDVNGIAQGYSVDFIANQLSTMGIHRYVVEIGGELRIKGPKPDGTPMKIGIEGPDSLGIPIIRHVIALNDGAITTSGNYRKYRESGHQKISHLIDPRSGYPIHSNLISVTLYARDAITADGYDNAVMAMNLPEAIAFVKKHKDMDGYFIYQTEQGVIRDTMTTGFSKMITATK